MKEYKLAELEAKFAELIWHKEPIAFGDRKVKERGSSILSYHKKALLTVVLTAAVLVAVGLGLAINPEAKSDMDEPENINNINLQYKSNMAASEELNEFVQEYAVAFCD